MRRTGKRMLSILACTALLIVPFSGSVWADSSYSLQDGYNWNLKDGMAVSGVKDLYAAAANSDGNLSILVDGVALPASSSTPTMKMYYVGGDGISSDRDIKTDTYYAANNQMGVNGVLAGKLPSDGTKGVALDATQLVDGDNLVYLIIGGYDGAAVYDETKPHGMKNQGNKDDFLISNVRFEMPDGSTRTPDYLVTHKAKAVGSTEKVVETLDPYPYAATTKFWLGDGWGTYDTWAGNPDARFNIPYKVDFGIRYDKPQNEQLFTLDTSLYTEGTHTVTMMCDGTTVASAQVVFDSTAPVIDANLQNYQQITADTTLNLHFSDAVSGLKEQSVYLENKLIGTGADASISFAGKANGLYAVTMYAADKAGNITRRTLYVRVADTAAPGFAVNGNLSVTPDADSTVTLSGATVLPYTAGYGSNDSGTPDVAATTAYDSWYQYQMTYGTGTAVSASSASGIPYQMFTVDLQGKTAGMVTLSFEGSTLDNERLAMKIWNPTTQAWEKVSTLMSSGRMSALADAATYNTNGKLLAVVQPDYTTNGSNQLYWTTDPQHYTKFADLNSFYEKIYQYAADGYASGDLGYLIQTGDIVDDGPTSSLADKQWTMASNYHKLTDDVGMPYGVVTGNHDTDNYPSQNYSKFWQYFPASRYNDNDWYGGSLQNNQSHFDLVTVGNVDFLFLYLGYGTEATDETIAWANQVLQAYPNRNAVICTHQYLKNSIANWDSASRASAIYNEIVVPNENVKMVLCGHDDGSQVLQKTIGDRVVYELLSDYQFVEEQSLAYYGGHTHYIGSVPKCNGDGYVRTMTIDGNTLTNSTFSVVTGGTNPFGNREKFSIAMDFDAAQRTVSTTKFSAYVTGDTITSKAAKAGETVTATGAATNWVASFVTTGGAAYSTVYTNNLPTPPQQPTTDPVTSDYAALGQQIAEVKSLDATLYSATSWAVLQSVLDAVTPVYNNPASTNAQITEAYYHLSNARGQLKLKSADDIDPSKLVSLYDYSLSMDKWRDTAGHTLNSAASYLDTVQTPTGGLTIKKSAVSPNNWPAMIYQDKAIELTPHNGKIYASLDVTAHSSWTLFFYVKQGTRTGELRLNYMIEQFSDKTGDGGAGTYQGIYDVTKAFTDMGFDVTKSLTLTSSYLYAVPGDVTYEHFEFLTDEEHYARGDLNDDKDINMTDASILFDHASGKVTIDNADQLRAGDISGRGQVDMQDALRLYQYASGVSNTL